MVITTYSIQQSFPYFVIDFAKPYFSSFFILDEFFWQGYVTSMYALLVSFVLPSKLLGLWLTESSIGSSVWFRSWNNCVLSRPICGICPCFKINDGASNLAKISTIRYKILMLRQKKLMSLISMMDTRKMIKVGQKQNCQVLLMV